MTTAGPFAWISPARVSPPPTPSGVLGRGPLIQRLHDAARSARVVAIHAPAGSGKTTTAALLASHTTDPTSWLTVLAGDDDPDALAPALAVSLFGRTAPASVAAAAGPGAGQRPPVLVGGAMLAALEPVATRARILVLDDVHHVEGEWGTALLTGLVEQAPADLTVVLVGRWLPEGLPCDRWNGRGHLAVFGLDDLRFSATEVAQVLRRKTGTEQPTLTRRVYEGTGGWPAGVRLLASSRTAGAPREGEAIAQPTPEIAQLLVTEVVETLPPNLRWPLLRCAVLEELDPVGVMAVAGPSGPTMVEELRTRQLFVTPLAADGGRTRWAFHPAFRTVLLELLSVEADVPALHRLVGHALQDPIAAIPHLCEGGDRDSALRRLAEVGQALVSSGRLATLRRLVAMLDIDGSEGQEHLGAVLFAGVAARTRADFEQAETLLQVAAAGSGSAADFARLQLSSVISTYRGEYARSYDLALAVDESSLRPFERSYRALNLAWAALHSRPREEGTRWLASAVETARRHPEAVEVLVWHIRSPLLALPGGRALVEDALDIMKASAGAKETTSVRQIDGRVSAAQGILGPAIRLLADTTDASLQTTAMPNVSVDVLGLLPLTSFAPNPTTLDVTTVADGLVWSFRAWTGTLLLLGGAAAVATDDQQTTDRIRRRGRQPIEGFQWVESSLAIRVLICLADLKRGQAAVDLEALDRLADITDGLTSLPNAHAIRAIAQRAGGDAALARRTADQVVSDVRETGDACRLLLWGRWVSESLVSLATVDIPEQLRRAGLERTDTDRLTDRELEVLVLLAQGRRNADLAEELFVSLATVKTHVSRIMRKLDARSRSEAVARARTEGLLPG